MLQGFFGAIGGMLLSVWLLLAPAPHAEPSQQARSLGQPTPIEDTELAQLQTELADAKAALQRLDQRLSDQKEWSDQQLEALNKRLNELAAWDQWLQRVYWGSQITLAIIALGALVVAWTQLNTFKLIELLKHIEQANVREGRADVLLKIQHLKGTEWWSDDQLRDAASRVASSYDHVGSVFRYSAGFRYLGRLDHVGRFFVERWGAALVLTHDAMQEFLRHRRQTSPQAYDSYTWLYRFARENHPHVHPPAIQPSEEVQNLRRELLEKQATATNQATPA